MANQKWTRTSLGLQLASELDVHSRSTAGDVPENIAAAVAEAFDYLWIVKPWRSTVRRMALTWTTDLDVLRVPSAWTGTSSPTLGGAYTGTKLDCYTFTAGATGTVGETEALELAVTDFDGEAVATLAIDDTYTPGDAMTVANGITISMPEGGVVKDQVFYVDVRHDTALLPLWNYPGDPTRQYGDLRKLQHEWLKENNKNGPLVITAEIPLFEEIRQNWSDSTGTPTIAMIEKIATVMSVDCNAIRVAPAPSDTFSYVAYYLCNAPTLGLTTVPNWPPFMFLLWREEASWRVLKALGRATWEARYAIAVKMIHGAKEENDETMENSVPLMRAGLDMTELASAHWAHGML